MLNEIIHVLEHTLLDTLKVVPLLFLTYLGMEYLEHKAEEKVLGWVNRAGKLGPFAGAVAGAVPQCGFSAAGSNLYAARIISPGTLFAIYLSTSDEMLPILISQQQSPRIIAGLLLGKIAVGMAAGLLVDLVFRGKRQSVGHEHIHEICQQENCHCEQGIWRSALRHTVQIVFFLLIITFALNLLLEFGGEEFLAELLEGRLLLGPVLAGLVGLIPNCASSVVLTKLYVSGTLNLGAAMAGLLANCGIGLLVLFRVNHNKKENLTILTALYLTGVAVGILLEIVL